MQILNELHACVPDMLKILLFRVRLVPVGSVVAVSGERYGIQTDECVVGNDVYAVTFAEMALESIANNQLNPRAKAKVMVTWQACDDSPLLAFSCCELLPRNIFRAIINTDSVGRHVVEWQ